MVSITATGSTASRAEEDRFADWVNVKDFGAVGGSAGDKAAFEAAVASVTGNYATIYVPRAASSYTIGSSVNVLGKNVSYIFEGGAAVSNYDNLNGAVLRPQRLVRKTWGNRDAACGYTVRLNDGDIEAEILGISTDSQLATYTDRDSVGTYVHNRAPAVLHTCTSCTYTATTVSFTNAIDTTKLRVGMYIDTAHSPKYTGKITSWTSTQITVTGWYQVGNTASGQVPANGTNCYVNPTTKVWAHNANVLLRSDSHASHACGFELGIIQEKGTYNESTDEPRTWGYDIVNLTGGQFSSGTGRCSVGFIQRNDFRHGFESRDAYRAGFVATSTGVQVPTYGFLAESGQNRFAALSGAGTLSWSVSADGNMEVGRSDVSNTPSIDFHSSGTTSDYDARLRSEGGSSTAGSGTLRATAAQFRVFSSAQQNAVDLLGASNGSAVTVKAVGTSDANINLALTPKGTGIVTAGSSVVSAGSFSTPVGGTRTFGFSASTDHQAGNAGSVGLTVTDGGGASGVFVNNTHGGTYSSQDITFKTAKGGVSVSTERARITSDGDMLIGQSSTTVPGYGGNTTLGMALWGSGGRMFLSQNDFSNWNMNADGAIVHFNRSGSSVGNISITTTSTAYNSASDYRLKQDVEVLTNALDRLSKLKPSRFAFKAEPDRRVDGFIAHEVSPACPEAVQGEKDGETMQSMDASKLVPLLTAALQEAVRKIDDLNRRVASLEGPDPS